jgi:hypothetical protein
MQRKSADTLARMLVTLLAMAGGGVIGFAVTLAIVVAKARAGAYIFALEDLLAFRWETAPIAIGLVLGILIGHRHPNAIDRATVWGLATMLLGVGCGILIGSLWWGEGEGQWAGGIIFGATGLAAGGTASLWLQRGRIDVRLLAGVRGALMLLAFALLVTVGLTNLIRVDPLELQPSHRVPVPHAEDVDAVVFLLGDAGAIDEKRSPLLYALAADVEWWSRSLARDSAVSIVFLGDVVYPEGVHERTHPAFPTDSARLWNQIGLVGGPDATRHATIGLFLAGNHDWGNTTGDAGMDRISNLNEQLLTARRVGYEVSLLPPPGQPGPIARDLRSNARIVFLDTHWFLQDRSTQAREEFFAHVEEVLRNAGERAVVFVAHHPYISAGPHGVLVPGYHTGGIAFLLKKSGALVQDLNSSVYSDFLARMRQTFVKSEKPPLIFAGGHDHSLQVLIGTEPFDPPFSLVSGAGSKLSSIRMTDGLIWGAAQPGYMMLAFRKNGAVDLFAIAADEDYLACSVSDAELAQCMADGTRSFRIQYSRSLLQGNSHRGAR